MRSSRLAPARGPRAVLVGLALLLLPALALSPLLAEALGEDAPPRLRLYYDDGSSGNLYARALQSWLGHFRVRVVRAPVEGYRQGELRDADFVAYIGARFDNSDLPAAFLEDVRESPAPVLWLNYNIWHLLGRGGGRYGFTYVATDAETEFAAVRYKGAVLPRDSRAGLVRVRAAAAAAVLATAVAPSGEESPYVVHGGNLFYVADAVFDYLTSGDRSLVLADVLHTFLGQAHEEARYALIRIEDVHPRENVMRLRWIADYLASEGVPFSIAVIPVHRDGRGREARISDPERARFVEALRYMRVRGGWIMLHGYTHQYDGVTRRDWEFWDEQRNRPLPEASEAWALERVRRGQAELTAVGLPAYAWVTPHYMAEEAHYRAFARLFPIAYERQFLYDERIGGLLLFYPYASIDLFGRRVVPETLDTPEGAWRAGDLLAVADRLRVVRCGVASFYIHVEEVRQVYGALVAGIKQRGYTFVDPGPRSPVWRFLPPP
jgi:uncharacterized protein YdaL